MYVKQINRDEDGYLSIPHDHETGTATVARNKRGDDIMYVESDGYSPSGKILSRRPAMGWGDWEEIVEIEGTPSTWLVRKHRNG